MTASTFDLIVLGLVGLSALFGFWRGFVREVFVLIAWGAAAAAAILLTPALEGFVASFFSEPAKYQIVAQAITFVGLFVVTLFAFSYLGSLISSLITDKGVTAVNRTLGMMFGVVRGLVVAGVGLFGYDLFLRTQSDVTDPAIGGAIPAEIKTATSYPAVEFAAALLNDLAVAVNPELVGQVEALVGRAGGARPAATPAPGQPGAELPPGSIPPLQQGGGLNPQLTPQAPAPAATAPVYTQQGTQQLERTLGTALEGDQPPEMPLRTQPQ